MASASSAAVVAAEVKRLAAEERAADAELRATLSQIAALQSCGEPEPESEPEPDDDPALARTLTQEAYSRLVEHPKLSAAERERVRSVAAARQERKAAGARSEEEGDDEEEDDDGAGTGLFFRHPSNPARTWSQERLDAASMELEALRENILFAQKLEVWQLSRVGPSSRLPAVSAAAVSGASAAQPKPAGPFPALVLAVHLVQGFFHRFNRVRLIVFDAYQAIFCLGQFHQNLNALNRIQRTFSHQHIVGGDIRLTLCRIDDQGFDVVIANRHFYRRWEACATHTGNAASTNLID